MNFVQLIGCIRTVKKCSEYGTKSAYFWLFGLKSAQFRHAFDSGTYCRIFRINTNVLQSVMSVCITIFICQQSPFIHPWWWGGGGRGNLVQNFSPLNKHQGAVRYDTTYSILHILPLQTHKLLLKNCKKVFFNFICRLCNLIHHLKQDMLCRPILINPYSLVNAPHPHLPPPCTHFASAN